MKQLVRNKNFWLKVNQHHQLTSLGLAHIFYKKRAGK